MRGRRERCPLGDDVHALTPHWFPRVRSVFREMEEEGIPCGMGCVALMDEASPGFPTFPVVRREHVRCFSGFRPQNFVNQDADPWVFALYSRWGAARFAQGARIRNAIGGTESQPRYQRVHADWKGHVLHQSVKRAAAYFAMASTHLCLDVIVPTSRCDVRYIETIAKLPIPAKTVTTVHVIVDNPDTTRGSDLKHLERVHIGKVRVRVLPFNSGVSAARNRGFNESSADWVVFLDDDVIPDRWLIREYARCIRSEGSAAAGFVGMSTFPPAREPRTMGVELSYLTYFWRIARRTKTPPWGVTANLCIRKTNCRFSTDFVKTGGGEDIALCLDTVMETGLPLRSAPQARVVHPWWDNGRFSAARFFGWTQGDTLLMFRYPNLTYWCFPNEVELSAACGLVFSLAGRLDLALVNGCIILATFFSWEAGRAALEEPAKILSLRNRLASCIFAAWFVFVVDVGHFWALVRRGRFTMLSNRFDWHCSLQQGTISHERNMHLRKFMAYICSVMLSTLSATVGPKLALVPLALTFLVANLY